MLDISSARVMRCVVHRVGNRLREEGCELSQQEVHGTAELHGTLLRHYLAPIAKTGEAFELYHESDIELNAVRQFSSRIFSESDDFITLTQHIAKQLYASSVHSSIAAGEFIAILFCDVRIDDESHFALGLYKIEERETFLDVERTDDSLNLVELSGIPVSSIQKGALIVDNSFEIYIKESSGQQTKYWAESFLKARPRQTEKSTAKLTAQFVKQVCSRIDMEAGMSLRRDLVDVFSANETLSFRDVEEVSERYLDRDEVSRLAHQLADQSGFSSLATSAIDSATLVRQTRNVLRQYPLSKGIGITISNPTARLEKCTIKKTKCGYQAIIDINLESGE
ncbi:nucleoid-associated protein [Paracidovorax oryzae]|uniref:nucleoid-associated protein n=1 Tax=Paracidovorax oryzae TaxID=862720 RepID=UPI0035D12815